MEQVPTIYISFREELFKDYIKEIDGYNSNGQIEITYKIHHQSNRWIILEIKSIVAISFYHLGKRVAHLH